MPPSEEPPSPLAALRRYGSIAVVFVTLAAAVPVAAGLAARRAHERGIAELQEALGTAAELRVERYELGWLSSHAVLAIAPATGVAELRVEETIAHGPFPWLALMRGRFAPGLALLRAEWRPELPAPASELLGEQAALQLSVHVGFDRALRAELSSPALSAPGFEWRGVTGWAQLRAGEGWGEFDVPGLRATQSGRRVEMDGLRGQFRAYRTAHGLPLGEWSVSLERFEFGRAGQGDHCVIAGLELAEFVDERPLGLLDAWVRGAVQRARCGGGDYAPASLEFAMRNLDAVVLSVLQARLAQSESEQERMHHILEQLPALLEREPQLELVRLHVPTPDGALDWSGRLWLPPQGSQARHPLSLLASLRAEAKLVTPRRWLHRWMDEHVATLLSLNPQRASLEPRVAAVRSDLFQDWRRRGWLRQEGERYVAQLRLADAQLRIGGVPLDPRSLAGEIQSVALRDARETMPSESFPASPGP